MAFIQYCSPSPKHGIKEHVSREVAAACIAAGLAVEVHLSEEEKKRLRFGVPLQTELPAPVWTVEKHPATGEVTIIRKFQTETTFMSAVPKDTSVWPWRELSKERVKEIREQFEAMVSNGGARGTSPAFSGKGWREEIKFL